MQLDPTVKEADSLIWEQVEIQVKYRGYIDRQLDQVERSKGIEGTRIPPGFNYGALSVSTEVREKLEKFQPDTLGQATRIPGVTPAAIAILSVALKARGAK
jgi:tRNA uridine 5-carboxymethylaminomethyl modification enzyme